MPSHVIGMILQYLTYAPDMTFSYKWDDVSPIEYENIIMQARYQGVAPLLYHRYISSGIDMPQQLVSSFRKAYLANVARNMRLYHILESLLQLCDDHQIPVIVLKGAFLAEAIYGNIGLREMADIDLLVKLDDLQRIDQLLIAWGYQPVDHHRVISRDNRCFDYIHRTNGTLVEIHWSLAIAKRLFNIDIDGLWMRAQKTSISSKPAMSLCTEDLLLHLCLHTAQHASMMSIYMLCDIGEIIRRVNSRVDWQALASRAHQWGICRSVYTILHLSRELLQVEVPKEFLHLIFPEGFDIRWYELAKQQFVVERSTIGAQITPQVVRLWRVKNLWQKLGILWASWLLPRDEMSRMYPASADSWRIYLFYLVRLFDISKRHLASWLTLLGADYEAKEEATKLEQKLALQDWLMSR